MGLKPSLILSLSIKIMSLIICS